MVSADTDTTAAAMVEAAGNSGAERRGQTIIIINQNEVEIAAETGRGIGGNSGGGMAETAAVAVAVARATAAVAVAVAVADDVVTSFARILSVVIVIRLLSVILLGLFIRNRI